MKPTITWIVIADGARAHVVCNAGPGKGIEIVEGMTLKGDHSSTSEIMADRPGRSFDSVGHARHSMENPSDPHEVLKARFVSELTDALEARDGSYDRLVLVAPPTALGLLRKSLGASAAAKVVAELHKDLTHVPVSQLPDHLRETIAI